MRWSLLALAVAGVLLAVASGVDAQARPKIGRGSVTPRNVPPAPRVGPLTPVGPGGQAPWHRNRNVNTPPAPQPRADVPPQPKPSAERVGPLTPVGPGGQAPWHRKPNNKPPSPAKPLKPVKPAPVQPVKPAPFKPPGGPIGPGGVAPQYRQLKAAAPANLGSASAPNAPFATPGDLRQDAPKAVPFDAKKVNQYTPPVTCTEPLKNAEGLVLHPQRQRTLDIARAYIGKMGDYKGKRYGSDLFMDIYNTAYNSDMTDKRWGTFASAIKTAGKKPNSWCGIFAVAINRKGGLDSSQWARWDAKPAAQPIGLASKATAGHSGFAPGDILIIKDKPGSPPLNHHCICESVDGSKVVTIDGNSWNDKAAITNTIRRTVRNVNDVVAWYRTQKDVWVKADPKRKACPYTDLPSAAPAPQK